MQLNEYKRENKTSLGQCVHDGVGVTVMTIVRNVTLSGFSGCELRIEV
jgi:hypothetical protein